MSFFNAWQAIFFTLTTINSNIFMCFFPCLSTMTLSLCSWLKYTPQMSPNVLSRQQLLRYVDVLELLTLENCILLPDVNSIDSSEIFTFVEQCVCQLDGAEWTAVAPAFCRTVCLSARRSGMNSSSSSIILNEFDKTVIYIWNLNFLLQLLQYILGSA